MEWVSVENKIPPVNERVLICHEYEGARTIDIGAFVGYSLIRHRHTRYVDGKKIVEESYPTWKIGKDRWIHRNPIAWMKLPEIYNNEVQ